MFLFYFVKFVLGFIISPRSRHYDSVNHGSSPYPVVPWFNKHLEKILQYKLTKQKPTKHPIVTKDYCKGCCYNPA